MDGSILCTWAVVWVWVCVRPSEGQIRLAGVVCATAKADKPSKPQELGSLKRKRRDARVRNANVYGEEGFILYSMMILLVLRGDVFSD